MKNILLLCLLVFVSVNVLAQDLIVTQNGDSINCEIKKIETDHIYFNYTERGRVKNSELPVLKISNYQFGYYAEESEAGFINTEPDNWSRLRLCGFGGVSRQLGKTSENVPPEFEDYIDGLRSGAHFGGDITYFFNDKYGVGVRYSRFHTSNRIDNVFVEDIYGHRVYGVLSDDIKISYIGPTFSWRFLSDKNRNAAYYNLSIGRVGYENNAVVVSDFLLTSSTLGLIAEIAYDFCLTEHSYLSFKLAVMRGSLFEYDLDNGSTKEKIDLEKDQYESVSRVDFSIGLSFGL